MKPILEIHNVSKRYRIEHLSRTYPTFREKILQTFQRSGHSSEEFWALKDVSFTTSPGESMGIIGRNGAGKSTLLKILSKITPPTSGKIISRGRIASLLEVGTGFHPELTGRENIFFNGSLLGMKRREIDDKFDEIVAFSGVEKFLDTPLKHFSSGMQLRLAFAVAAFLEPEILIIDEVLAVGDAEFQKKCLGKMQNVIDQGRTVLFVSHNLHAIKSFCNKNIWVDNGKIKQIGGRDVVENYLAEGLQALIAKSQSKHVLTSFVSIVWISTSNSEVKQFENLNFAFTISSGAANKIVEVALLIYNQFDERVSIFDLRSNALDKIATKGEVNVNGTIMNITLVPGIYQIRIFINSRLFVGNSDSLTSFTVVENALQNGRVPFPIESRGIVDLHGEFFYE
jgi:lipopolysaccharide transport system ATP-binding protein